MVLGLQVVSTSPVSVVYSGLFKAEHVETRDNRSVIQKLTVLILMRIVSRNSLILGGVAVGISLWIIVSIAVFVTVVDTVSTAGDAHHLVGNLIARCRHFAVVIVTVTGYRVLLA